MSWRDQMQAASFRGVPFHTEGSEGTFGRRTVTHEYPLRDLPYVEDLGRKAREVNVEAFIIGPDYMNGRDALIRALEQPGPGTLVHPYRGALRVVLTDARLRESSDAGGMARFTLSFVEAGDNQFPRAVVDTPAVVSSRADAALAALQTDFTDQFSVDAMPAFVTDAGKSLLGRAADALRDLAQSLPGIPGEIPGFLSDVQGFQDSLGDLIRAPNDLAARALGLISGLGGVFSNPLDAFAVYGRLLDFGDDEPATPRTTATRIRQSDNQAAITQLVQRAALIEQARASSRVSYPSYPDAISTRDQIAEQLDAVMETADDALYVSLSALRTAVIADIQARGADLARIIRVTPAETLPALVLAHQLYGDATQDGQLISRNRIRHPGFVPGGRELEVLNG